MCIRDSAGAGQATYTIAPRPVTLTSASDTKEYEAFSFCRNGCRNGVVRQRLAVVFFRKMCIRDRISIVLPSVKLPLAMTTLSV